MMTILFTLLWLVCSIFIGYSIGDIVSKGAIITDPIKMSIFIILGPLTLITAGLSWAMQNPTEHEE